MINTLIAKIFGTKNDRELKAMRPLVAAINEQEPLVQKLSDQELAARTVEFRDRLANRIILFVHN